MRRARLDAHGAATWAGDAVRPTLVSEERLGGRVVGEHADQVYEGDPVAVSLPRCAHVGVSCMGTIVP